VYLRAAGRSLFFERGLLHPIRVHRRRVSLADMPAAARSLWWGVGLLHGRDLRPRDRRWPGGVLFPFWSRVYPRRVLRPGSLPRDDGPLRRVPRARRPVLPKQ
jgi:hypothetical protein